MKRCVKAGHLRHTGKRTHERAYAGNIVWLMQPRKTVQFFQLLEYALRGPHTVCKCGAAMHDPMRHRAQRRKIRQVFKKITQALQRQLECIFRCRAELARGAA